MAVWELQAYLSLSLNNVNLSKGVNTLDEHALIQTYFSDVGSAYLAEQDVRISVGDDSSIISLPSGKESVVSVDTSIENIHFLDSMSPEDIAYRAVVVALSDLAACGAAPAWYSVALTFPELDEDWLKKFSDGLRRVSDDYKIPLIGGDTTKGNLSITVQVNGYCDTGLSILRSNAKPNENIYVSGLIGEAAKGLNSFIDKLDATDQQVESYLRPKARIDLGLRLKGVASAAIDISDGLLQDLKHICVASGVGAQIELDDIPTSFNTIPSITEINAGDDYEICFTSSAENESILKEISEELGIKISLIGKINDSEVIRVFDKEGNDVPIEFGYSHF